MTCVIWGPLCFLYTKLKHHKQLLVFAEEKIDTNARFYIIIIIFIWVDNGGREDLSYKLQLLTCRHVINKARKSFKYIATGESNWWNSLAASLHCGDMGKVNGLTLIHSFAPWMVRKIQIFILIFLIIFYDLQIFTNKWFLLLAEPLNLYRWWNCYQNNESVIESLIICLCMYVFFFFFN